MSAERLKEHVQNIVNIFPRHAKAHENISKVRTYIADAFSSCGYKPVFQTLHADGLPYENVIATYNPEGERTIVIGAHYDAEGQEKESVSPGADDNASGVAGLLETARILMERNPLLEDRIEFVAYCNGEPPYLGTSGCGSMHHAESLKKEKRKVALMVCLKMIGFFSDAPASQIRRYLPPALKEKVPMRGDFIAVMGKASHQGPVEELAKRMKEGTDLNVVPMTDRNFDLQIIASDQISYWKQGYTALVVTDTAQQRNLNYHTPQDKIETLDFVRMAKVVSGLETAIRKWAREA